MEVSSSSSLEPPVTLSMLALGVRPLRPDFDAAMALDAFVAGMLSGLAVGFVEETFFRGLLQGAVVRETRRPLAAILLVSIVYSAVHFLARVKIPHAEVAWDSGLTLLQSVGANFAAPGRIADSFLALVAVGLLLGVVTWWTGSIAVLTDALHDAGDCLVLGTAWYLQRVALKGRDAHYSYGYGRYSMLGGWLTSVVLIVGALVMLWVSVPELWAERTPDTVGMMGIAVFGLLMNGLAAWKLHGGGTLNERGAYLHLLEDVLGWAAVLVIAMKSR